ncbi:fungal-specific transcription factor domain-containing protein [Papiliotrema laurentii]|uniref:Fungal-specific transcription factor domain-containing protein n=1 Tax=Papiliotrema laurentii TaxID=5418 RepID=A0AAD9FPS9_PAPLA|nr:fungal-specific transcription factor domain-containing protein [Papiliotrema laurentii]
MSNQSPFYQAPGHPSHNPGQSPLSQSNSTFRPYPPVRQESFTPHTPSNLSHASSPAAGPPYSMATPSSSANRAGPSDLAGPSRRTADRKHSIDTSQDEPSGKKKRVSLSCAQCAKRKQKCNREFPCQHCIARKVPELCVPYNPQSHKESANGPDPQTASRLDKIEDVLSVILRHHGGLWGYKDVKEYMSHGPFNRVFPATVLAPSSPHRRSLALGAENHFAIPHHLGTTVSTPIHVEEHAQDLDGGGSLTDDDGFGRSVGKGWLGDLEGGVPESMNASDKVSIKLDQHGTPAENLQRLITDCGVSPHKVAELVQELPPKPFADRVIDWFFSGLNYVRYPIDERLFRISYEDLYNKHTAVDPSNVRALPLVFIVLAMAVRLAPEEWAGDEQTRKLSSLRMYWSSRRSILIATAIQSESVELVVTRLLSAMYLVLIHDRRLTECWSQLGASLRTAQAIGLHRDGSKLGLDPFQTEYRRRLWSYLYHADKLYSLVLGRPPSISDSYADAQLPSNLELSEFNTSLDPNANVPQPRPLSEPTTATFLILRSQLAKIVGRIVHHFQKLDEPAQYSDVERLQRELETFSEQLPPHFRMHRPDKSLDKTLFWLPVHRFMLLTEILVTTIILHRPWLLRKLSSNRYAASRTSCFEAAKLDFRIRQEFSREVPDFRLFAITGQFKMFNSAMIAGISAIIDPRGPDSEQMRKILTTFLEENPWHEVASKDETTKKEVQIIHTLSRRAAQIYEDSLGPNEHNPHEKDSASLLLALRQSGDASASGELGGRPHMTGMNKGWMSLANPLGHVLPMNVGSGVHQSPASSIGQEDDHSQRLLDNWLNANTSLAVGTSMSGIAPPVDPAGLGYAPYSALGSTSGPSLNPVPFSVVAPSPAVGHMTMNPASTNMNWNDELGGGLSGAPANSEFGMSFNSAQPVGLDGMTLGHGTVGPNGTIEGENSDEYWNALIDGILGTTGTAGLTSGQMGQNGST